jgi:hypothetical protein
MKTRTGAVIVFRDGVTKADAEAFLHALRGMVEYQIVETFNPDHGCPVWYIP